VDYWIGRALSRHQAQDRQRKRLLLISLGTNLGILGFFKYWDFFIHSAGDLLVALGFEPNLPSLRVILPVGISFYTFQTMAYTIDVYRRRMEAEREPLVFAIYVAYFPQLVAGPIERAQRLIPQIRAPARVDGAALGSGALLVLIGLVRKVAVADTVAPVVDRIFENPAGYGSGELALGALLFAVQIYSDFAGYTDMARGLSRMLGIELMENFQHPYIARSITDFWRRWHVSLSTWLRDYLYIPLGGNRGGSARRNLNIMLTMLLGGLWHGAAWTFVIWGGLHGLALIAHKAWLERSGFAPLRRILSTRGGDVLPWMITMGVVGLCWIFFRSPDLTTAVTYLQGLVGGGFSISGGHLRTAAAAFVVLLLIDVPQLAGRSHTAVLDWPLAARGLLYAFMILILTMNQGGPDVPFIYFQF
jgi:alginate O-acetyltransferase complex protein AlgI